MNWTRITTESGIAVAGRNRIMNVRVWNRPVAAASRNVGKSAANVGIRNPSEKTLSTTEASRPVERASANAAGIASASVRTSENTVTSAELTTASPRSALWKAVLKLPRPNDDGSANGLAKISSFVLNAEATK